MTSPSSWECNCIAWAAGASGTWWWPAPGRYWPPGAPREETITAFLAAFATLGFVRCAVADLDSELEKIALYAALGGQPTHAARQLANGWWTSKLGPSVDIEHTDPEVVGGGIYGQVVALLSRKRA